MNLSQSREKRVRKLRSMKAASFFIDFSRSANYSISWQGTKQYIWHGQQLTTNLLITSVRMNLSLSSIQHALSIKEPISEIFWYPAPATTQEMLACANQLHGPARSSTATGYPGYWSTIELHCFISYFLPLKKRPVDWCGARTPVWARALQLYFQDNR